MCHAFLEDASFYRFLFQIDREIAQEVQSGGCRCGGVLQTFYRWLKWWREVFLASRYWQAARSCFMPPVDSSQLPGALLGRFHWGKRHCE